MRTVFLLLFLCATAQAQTHRVHPITTIWSHYAKSESEIEHVTGTDSTLPTEDADVGVGLVSSSELHTTECLTNHAGGDNWSNANTRSKIHIADETLHQTWDFASRCGIKDPGVTARANSMLKGNIDADLYYTGGAVFQRVKYELHIECSGDVDMTDDDEFYFSQKFELDDSEVELTYAYGFYFLIGQVRAQDLQTMIPVNEIWFPTGTVKEWDIPIFVGALRNISYPCNFTISDTLWETKGLRLEKATTGYRDLKKYGGMYLDFVRFD